MAQAVHAYQIFYDEATRAEVDPAFEPLDNLRNERPDWYEYWPIRRFFLEHPDLDETAHYGFFSTHFRAKTLLHGRDVVNFAREAADADVITFSPYPCHGAVFTNVFEHGAQAFPGFLEVVTEFLADLNPGFRPDMVVHDSRDTVYCNYFLAKPRFWRVWQRIVERAFELAEEGRSPLANGLLRSISYQDKPTEMKIMVLERMASFLLSSGAFAVRNYPPFDMPLSKQFEGRLADIQALDRLKMVFRETGDPKVMQEFVGRRNALLKEVTATRR
jgi:hypothetical protein